MSNVGLEILAGNKVQSKTGALGSAPSDITIGVKQGPRGQGKVLFRDTLEPFNPHPAPPSLAEITLSISSPDPGWDGGGSNLWPPVSADFVSNYNAAANEVVAYAGNPGYGYCIDPLGSGIVKPWDVETILDGDFISLGHTNVAGNVDTRIWINEMEISEWIDRTNISGVAEVYKTTIPMTTQPVAFYYTNIKFPDYGTYRIRYAGASIYFGITGNAGQVMRPPAKRMKAMVISDSWWEFTAWSSSSVPIEWKTQTGHDVINLAWGGTGYVKGAEFNPQRHYCSANRKAKIAAHINEADYIILNGSANDYPYPEQQVKDGMAELIEYIGSLRPNIPIYVVGLEDSDYFVSVSGYTVPWLQARENSLMDYAETFPQVMGTYRSYNDNILNGTGNTNAPNGTGNQDFFICGDGVHLDKKGARQHVAHLIAELADKPIFLEDVA